jgi:hypothetical protein
MAPRPSDVRAIEALLLSPAEDAAELARSVIEALDALRAERETYAVVAVAPYGVSWSYGPFATRHQAERAISKGVGVIDGGKTGVHVVYPMRQQVAPEPEPTCPACRHPRQAHNWPKSRIKGCVVGLPLADGKRSPHPRCDCEGDGKS